MKRKASRPSPYEAPAKLSKRSTSATATSNRSLRLKRSSTETHTPTSSLSLPPPSSSRIPKKKTSSVSGSPSLPKPNWPALEPPSRRSKDSASESMMEISEEPACVVPGLRRLSTLPLEEDVEQKKELSRHGSSVSIAGSTVLSKRNSSVTALAVATVETEKSVVTLDPAGTITTLTRLASGSSTGTTTGPSLAPPDVHRQLMKASSRGSLSRKGSSVRDISGEDAVPSNKGSISRKRSGISKEGPEDVPTSFRKSSSKASRACSLRKEESLAACTSTAPPVPLPPGGLIEIVFSFDTTGSMRSCINEVRGRVGDMIQRLQADIPGIRIAVIAHGDYCDADIYVIKWIDFGASVPELCEFVQTISGTGGGDFDECYELVLARAQTELSWTPGSQRSLVMIGDANPHPPSFYEGKEEQLNWRDEAKKLAAMGVKVYAVQALNNRVSTAFYQHLAALTNGHHLKLSQFSSIFDMLMVLCYNERGAELVQAYEDEVRTREFPAGLNKDLDGLFNAIRARAGKPKISAKAVISRGAAKGRPAVSAAAAAKGARKLPSSPRARKATTKTSRAVKGAVKIAAKKAGATKQTKKAGAKTLAKRAGAKKAMGRGSKTVKGRKPAKADGKKKPKKTTKPRTKKPLPGVRRRFREAVQDEEFFKASCLKGIKWTPWLQAIVPTKPRGSISSRFHPTRTPSSRAGFRNTSILKDEFNAPAVYEVAVQLKGKKRYVVFFKACTSWRRAVCWDTVLLNAVHIRLEVNAVLRFGGQIWLRRGSLKSVDKLAEAKRHISKMYDYAWASRKAGRRGATARVGAVRVRRLKKCNTLISGNSNS